jgi:hypothetical protein
MAVNIKNYFQKQYTAVTNVNYILNGHTAAFVDTDVSGSFKPGDILFMAVAPGKAGGDFVGARAHGSVAVCTIGLTGYVTLTAQVSGAGHVDFYDDSGALTDNNTYRIMGYWR